MNEVGMQQFLTLEDIQKHKDGLKNEIRLEEEKIASEWHSLFREHPERSLQSPSQRLSGLINVSVAALDGLILSWKLYKKYKKGVAFFRRKRR